MLHVLLSAVVRVSGASNRPCSVAQITQSFVAFAASVECCIVASGFVCSVNNGGAFMALWLRCSLCSV